MQDSLCGDMLMNIKKNLEVSKYNLLLVKFFLYFNK